MIFKLYNDTIELCFDPVKHKYTIDGKGIDGVSTSIKILAMSKVDDWAVNLDFNKFEELWDRGINYGDAIRMAKKFHAEQRDGRADLGTNVHKGIENFINLVNPFHEIDREVIIASFTEEEKARVRLFMKWADLNVDHFVDSERPIYSKKDKYCGTLDFTCVLKGQDGLWLGDIKNAKYIYPKNFLQTAAYQAAYTEETKRPIIGRIIVRLGDDYVEVVKRTKFKPDYASFKACLKLGRWYSKIEKELKKATRAN